MADIKKAVLEGTDKYGGYLTPEILSRKVYAIVQNNTVMVPLMEQVKLKSDTTYLPKNTKGSTAYWVAETQSITASTPEWERITLSPKKVAALTELSTELLEDAAVNPAVANYVMEQMGKDIGLSIDNEIINGTQGQFTNYLRSTGSFTNSVTCGASTNGGNITLAKISDAINEGEKDNFRYDVSIFNPRTVNSLRKLTDSNARPMFDEATFGSPILKDGALGTIYGTTVFATNQIHHTASYGTAGDATDAIIGTKKKFGVYGMRRNLTFHKDYDIAHDSWDYQANMRVAFNILYSEAYCVIRAILDD